MSTTGGSFGSGRKFPGAGGTPGGLGEFFLGLLLAGVGLYFFLGQVQVQTSYWRIPGLENSFGPSLVPLLVGIGILFFNGRSVAGWILTVGGLLFILVGVILHMEVYFRRTSLLNTLLMLGLLAAGLGLVFRSLRPHRDKAPG